jgi:hypothetical protein
LERDLSNPFDDALVRRELLLAADEYASRQGERGSPAYRAAWLRFRQRIKTEEDVRRWRAAVARRNQRAHEEAPTDVPEFAGSRRRR